MSAMNCVLLPKGYPMRLCAGSPKLAHIRETLGMRDGCEIFAGIAGEKLWVCRLHFEAGGGAAFEPLREVPAQKPMRFAAAVAFARPQIAQRILFEAACLGVSRLVFYPAAKGEAAYAKSSLYSGGKFSEWLEKGAEQACAPDIPEFFACGSLAEACGCIASAFPTPLRVAPDLYEATANLWDFAPRLAEGGAAACAVLGGERGFADSDREYLRGAGWTLVSMGGRVMRTDTAFISTCALCRAMMFDNHALALKPENL